MKEHVTLTQKEQVRIQVLNSLVAEQITLEQTASLMRVSERHTRRILAIYREEGPLLLLTVIADAEHPTPHRRR